MLQNSKKFRIVKMLFMSWGASLCLSARIAFYARGLFAGRWNTSRGNHRNERSKDLSKKANSTEGEDGGPRPHPYTKCSTSSTQCATGIDVPLCK